MRSFKRQSLQGGVFVSSIGERVILWSHRLLVQTWGFLSHAPRQPGRQRQSEGKNKTTTTTKVVNNLLVKRAKVKRNGSHQTTGEEEKKNTGRRGRENDVSDKRRKKKSRKKSAGAWLLKSWSKWLGFVHSQTHLQLFFSSLLFFSLENFYSPSWVTKHTVPTVIPAESPYSDIK